MAQARLGLDKSTCTLGLGYIMVTGECAILYLHVLIWCWEENELPWVFATQQFARTVCVTLSKQSVSYPFLSHVDQAL